MPLASFSSSSSTRRPCNASSTGSRADSGSARSDLRSSARFAAWAKRIGQPNAASCTRESAGGGSTNSIARALNSRPVIQLQKLSIVSIPNSTRCRGMARSPPFVAELEPVALASAFGHEGRRVADDVHVAHQPLQRREQGRARHHRVADDAELAVGGRQFLRQAERGLAGSRDRHLPQHADLVDREAALRVVQRIGVEAGVAQQRVDVHAFGREHLEHAFDPCRRTASFDHAVNPSVSISLTGAQRQQTWPSRVTANVASAF